MRATGAIVNPPGSTSLLRARIAPLRRNLDDVSFRIREIARTSPPPGDGVVEMLATLLGG
jgi:hypothetical protein